VCRSRCAPSRGSPARAHARATICRTAVTDESARQRLTTQQDQQFEPTQAKVPRTMTFLVAMSFLVRVSFLVTVSAAVAML
jgi:hypothetical protein